MKRKKELIVILSSLLVIVLSVSVAYFTTKILGEGKEISVESADLKVIFTSGSGTINGTNIEPGWSSGENTFTVKNESNGTYKYNIIIKDLVNTFVTEGFLQYKITSTDGGYTMADFVDVPKSGTAYNAVIAQEISIAKNTTHTYKVEFKYSNSNTVDQSDDMGKILNGKIFIQKYETTLASKLLEDNPTISTRNDFSTSFTTNIANTLYKAVENGTEVYYFAGQDTESTPINNWVKFGELYWRIIRTNSDGSIRMLYSGTSPNTVTGYIGQVKFNNTSSNSPKYVGYMYGDDDTTLDGIRANTNDSTIKKYIDNWYENNLTTYTNYLSKDAIYCNDRELASGSSYSTSSTYNFYFKSYERLSTNKTPTYDCANNKDAFSVNNSEAKLKYPIALMTADEIVYAGGVQDTNSPMWYYTNSDGSSIAHNAGSEDDYNWFLMSPYGYISPGAYRVKTYAIKGKKLSYDNLFAFAASVPVTRPVTSLKSCVLWKSGNGSAISPYEIIENGGC